MYTNSYKSEQRKLEPLPSESAVALSEVLEIAPSLGSTARRALRAGCACKERRATWPGDVGCSEGHSRRGTNYIRTLEQMFLEYRNLAIRSSYCVKTKPSGIPKSGQDRQEPRLRPGLARAPAPAAETRPGPELRNGDRSTLQHRSIDGTIPAVLPLTHSARLRVTCMRLNN